MEQNRHIFNMKDKGEQLQHIDNVRTREESRYDDYSSHNVFIFNWVDDYDDQINSLATALQHEGLENRVRVFNHLTSEELNNEVTKLTKTGFSLFQYVMVIILDNKSDNDYFIKTKDNVNVLVNSEILTLFKTNKSLDNLTRIFVIQKLEDFDDMNDDSGKYKSQAVIERTKCIQDKYNGLERLYEGLQFTIRAQEETDNFQNSPFISVFCRNFIEKSIDTPFPEIASNIQREIKLNYSINISFETNQRNEDNGILGKAADPEELEIFLG